ncbi:MAG: hypothetical protein NTX05_04480 [Fusobacteria bacterium]|nr:hypothetical protein [Fusobacteriota bacterium]
MSIIKYRTRYIVLIIVVILSFFLAKGAIYIRFHINDIIKYSLKKSINYEISFSSIKIENLNKIEVDNLSVKNSEGQTLFTVDSSQVTINWIDFFLTKQKIQSLKLNGANINLTIAKNGQVNFLVGMQSSGGAFSISDIPIKQFIISNSSMRISDLSKTVPFNMTLTDIKGAFNCYSSSKSTLSLSANSGTQSMSINGNIINKGYNIDLTLGGVQLTPAITEFLPLKGSGLTLLSGTASGSIDITEKDWLGTLNISNASVNYAPIKADIYGLNGTLSFRPQGIDLAILGSAKANQEIHPVRFNLQYYSSNEKLLIGLFLGGKFDQKDIDCYSLLSALPVKFNAVVENPSVAVSLTNGQLDFARVKIHVDTFNMNGLQLDNGDTILNYNGKKMQLEIPSFTGKLSYQGMPIAGTFTNIIVGQKNATGEFVLNAYNNQYYFNSLSGNFNFLFATKTPTCYIYNGKNIIAYTMNPKTQTLGLKLNVVDPISVLYKNYTFLVSGKGEFVGSDLYHLSGVGRLVAQNKYIAEPIALNVQGTYGIFNFNNTNTTKSGMEISGIFNMQNSKNFVYSVNAYNVMTPIDIPQKKNVKLLMKFDFYSNYIINGDFTHITIEFNGEAIQNKKYIASIKGNLAVKNLQTMESELSNGCISWNNLSINDIKSNFEKKSSGYQLSITNSENQISYIAQISSDFKTFNGSGYIQGLSGANITLGDSTLVSFNVGKLKLNTSGEILNPNIQILVQSAEFQTNTTQIISINGAISFTNENLITELTIDGTNTLKGNINFKTEKVNLDASISTADISRYANLPQLKNITLNSDIQVKGSFDSLSLDGQVKLENLPYINSISKGIEFIFNYDRISIGDLFQKGTLNVTKFIFLDSEQNTIYSLGGSYNFEKQYLKVTSTQSQIDLSQIDIDKHLSGLINTNVNISGTLSSLNGDISINGNNLNLNQIMVNSLDIEVGIVNGKFTVSKGKLQYNTNQNLTVSGNFTPTSSQYNLNLVGQEMNITILEPLFAGKITNVNGLANMNLAVNSNGYSGNIQLLNAGFTTLDGQLVFGNINGEIDVTNSNILISNIDGTLNGGTFILKNYQAKVPNLTQSAQFLNVFLASQYGDFVFNNINFNYQDLINLQLSGAIELIGNNIKSTLSVLSGQVTGIPQKKQQVSLADSISNITNSITNVFSSQSSDQKSTVDLNQPIILKPLIGINVVIVVNINSAIIVNIPSYTVVKNIVASIQGGGTINIQNGKINILGTFFTNTGSAIFMGNSYSIQAVKVSFQNNYQYLPEINPSISAYLSTIVNNNAIWININGNVKAMNASFSSSNSQLTQEDIASLLAFNTTAVNISAQGAAYDMIDKGISSELLSPYSNRIGQAVGLDSLNVDANFLTSGNNSGSGNIGPNPSVAANASINNPILGLSVSGTKNLYKDIISSTVSLQYSDIIPGKISAYTWTLNYNLFTSWKYKIFDTVALMTGFTKYYDLYGSNQTLGYIVNPQRLEDHDYMNYLFGVKVSKSFYNPFNF